MLELSSLKLRSTKPELSKIFKKISIQKFEVLIPLALILMILGAFTSVDTISLESGYKEASEFLIEDDCKRGLSTSHYIFKFYTGQRWHWLESRDQVISLYSYGVTHIAIDYMYYAHNSYEIAREILEKCSPAYVAENDVALNKYTLLETFSMQTVQKMLKDPYINHIYVYRIENVIQVL